MRHNYFPPSNYPAAIRNYFLSQKSIYIFHNFSRGGRDFLDTPAETIDPP